MTDLSAINSDYRRIGDTDVSVWEEELDRLDSPWKDRAATLREAASPLSALCLAMGVVENRWGSTGHYIKPADNNPMSLRPWYRSGKPEEPPGFAGIIKTPDTGEFLKFKTPEDGVREWKRRLTDPAYKGGVYNAARTVAEMIDIYAPPGDVHGGTGVDNADIGYASTVTQLLEKYAAMEADTPPAGDGTGGPTNGGDMAGMKAHTFPGAKGKVWLPDWITVETKIVDHRNVRSYQKSPGMARTTWHDTGNPSTNANAEYSWLAAGRPGGGAGGYNFIFDDKKIICCVPLDEVTWHAGTSTGNATSFGIEQAYGGGVNWQKSLEVGAALHGGLCAMMGWEVDTHLVQHRWHYGKWCPAQILNRGIWSQVVKMTADAARAATLAANGQSPTTPAPVYDTPVMIPELEAYQGKPDHEIPYRVNGDGWVALYVGDRVRATKATPRMRYSSGDGRVGPDIAKGEEFDVDWLLISADFPDTYYSPWATRIIAADTERVSDVKTAA